MNDISKKTFFLKLASEIPTQIQNIRTLPECKYLPHRVPDFLIEHLSWRIKSLPTCWVTEADYQVMIFLYKAGAYLPDFGDPTYPTAQDTDTAFSQLCRIVFSYPPMAYASHLKDELKMVIRSLVEEDQFDLEQELDPAIWRTLIECQGYLDFIPNDPGIAPYYSHPKWDQYLKLLHGIEAGLLLLIGYGSEDNRTRGMNMIVEALQDFLPEDYSRRSDNN